MKINLLILIIAINNLKCFAQTPPWLPNNGLVAWYPFTGNANDSSGNANDGTVYNAVLTADRFGTSNSAYHFDWTYFFGSCTKR
ncbi:hypothetical protein BH11BAC1_BH11BAC1_00100 [soil metagenome]